MAHSGPLQSLFSQKLDRAVFATYFLGAVVPMLALAVVVHRFVIPVLEHEADRFSTVGMISLILAVGMLSLVSFFALRRLIHGALSRMDADNKRLATILAASRNLSNALHTHAVADTSSSCALALTDAQAAYVLLQPSPGKPISVCESSGEDAASLFQTHGDLIHELLESAFAEARPITLSGKSSQSDGAPSTLAVVPMTLTSGLNGAFVVLDTRARASLSIDEVSGIQTLAGFTSVALQNAELQDSQRNFFAHVTEILVAALDAQLDRNDPRAGHGNRVAAVANTLGRELGLDQNSLQNLHFASLLHDIGYLKIDRALHYDAAQCKNHPVLGHRMLTRIRLWADVAPIVLYHHEWFDGTGHPEKRSGYDIPVEARIVAAADAFDKLTHEDAARPPLSVQDALARLTQSMARQFDPEVVEALRAVVARGDLVA